MKYMIVSDIHGDADCTEKFLAHFVAEGCDGLIILGDILYHGPRNDLPAGYAPKRVISLLNAIKERVTAINGNCDAEVDQMVLDFPVLADYAVLVAGEHMIYATHGHVYNEGKLPPLQKGDVLMHGHTHVPKCMEHENYLYINPGSVSIPKENSAHSYLTLEDGHLSWKSLDGTVYMEHTL